MTSIIWRFIYYNLVQMPIAGGLSKIFFFFFIKAFPFFFDISCSVVVRCLYVFRINRKNETNVHSSVSSWLKHINDIIINNFRSYFFSIFRENFKKICVTDNLIKFVNSCGFFFIISIFALKINTYKSQQWRWSIFVYNYIVYINRKTALHNQSVKKKKR